MKNKFSFSKKMKSTALALSFVCGTVAAQNFIHPGILHKESDFARMREKVARHEQPYYQAYQNLLASPEAQLSWASRATATVIRGGDGDNVSLLDRDVAAAYQHALIYKISGDVQHGNKARDLLNSWSATHTSLSGNADRYLASGFLGSQFANVAEMMRGYPGFDFERFKTYMLNVYYYPLVERFLYGNSYGADHNDACITNYRSNWDLGNMNAMIAIGVLCDDREIYDKGINYFKNGISTGKGNIQGGTGWIMRLVNNLYTQTTSGIAIELGQMEESGRDQAHTLDAAWQVAAFCETAWNQGDDLFAYSNSRLRKGLEYVARYNIMASGAGKYEDLPYTSYSRMQGSNCSWATESALGGGNRGKANPCWQLIYNHYHNRAGLYSEIPDIIEIAAQVPYIIGPSTSIHIDTYDNPGFTSLTMLSDSGSCLLPWQNMDIAPVSIAARANYGSAQWQQAGNLFTIVGTGEAGNTDNLHFVFRRLIDDGVLVARMTSRSGASTGKAGLMLRGDLMQGGQSYFFEITAANQWLKLERSGNTLTVSTSADGSNWTPAQTLTPVLPRDVYVGMAVTSADENTTATAVFDNVTFTQGNIRPVLQMLLPANNSTKYVAPANITVKGKSNDIDGSINRVEIWFDGAISGTAATPADFTRIVSGVAAGAHTIVVKSYDNSGNCTADTMQVTVKDPTEKSVWYKLDELSGTNRAADFSGNNLNATLYGTYSFVAGHTDNAIDLDGSTAYARLPLNFIENLSEFTVTAWIYQDTRTAWARLFDFGSSSASYMFFAPANDGGKPTFSILTPGCTAQTAYATRPLAAGAWKHIALTLKSDTLQMYIDGVAAGATGDITQRPYDLELTSSNTHYLGRSHFSADPYYDGKIDEFRIFNRALTAEEVMQVMNGNFSAIEGKFVDEEILKKEYYTLIGQKISAPQRQNIYIEKAFYVSGKTNSRLILFQK